ncbi:MAG: RagB/SusD family nutrient uptake outer membrane protein [Bacteroidales bacterium]|nr:RagB/SusD family nutrient uptake outer membrane protein [Bacteroidales bacterium]
MKNISIIIVILFSSLLFTSCEDYLTQDSPDKPTTDQIWVSYDAAESYMMSAYTYISNTGWSYHEYFYLPQNFRGDDIFPEFGTTAWGYLGRIVSFNNTAADVSDYIWGRWYKGIKLANDVIENVPNMDMISQEEKDQLVAEAKFLRAFYLFNLQKNFHAIVMPLNVAGSTGELQLPTSTREAVYKQLEEDFTFASKHLPLSWDDENEGRATRNAAFAFLGKTCLFNKENQKALDAFAEIKGQSLLSGAEYRSMFDGTNEVNDEIIFSRGYTADQMDILYLYHQLGVAMSPEELRGGWHMASISDYFMSQLEPNDIRRAASVLLSGEEFDGEVITFNDYPDFKMSIKYVESLSAIETNRSVVDLIMMRYADVVLMEAEAYYEVGNGEKALEKVNDIRERAGLDKVNLSGTQLRDEIRKQRMIELVGEGSRFYDLVRWDIAQEQLTTANQPYAKNFEAKHNYFPVPLEEVQRNPMVDPTPGF